MPIKKEHAQGPGTRAEGKEGGRVEGRKEGGEWKCWNVKKESLGMNM